MDEDFLADTDLDWFAVFQGGQVAHFATAGRGFVPLAVRASIATHGQILDFFHALEASHEIGFVEGHLPVFETGEQRERYVRSFADMARRGMFSYDVDERDGYRLIAFPRHGLQVGNLPREVARVIGALPAEFAGCIGSQELR